MGRRQRGRRLIIATMQFQVPQFIETEPKIVGPLTLRQFMYVGVAGLLVFFLFFILKPFFWFIIAAIVGLAALALAFGKYRGLRLTIVLKNILFYLWQPKLYLWKREETEQVTPGSKLKNLWLDLITKKPPSPPGK